MRVDRAAQIDVAFCELVFGISNFILTFLQISNLLVTVCRICSMFSVKFSLVVLEVSPEQAN